MINPATLPTDLIGKISTYLSNYEQNNLFNSNSILRKDGTFFKKIKLNIYGSLEFLRNEEFRKKILSRCKKFEEQIYLNVYNTNITNEDLKILKSIKVHTLDLSYCDNVSDVSNLGGVHTLNLRHCDNISDVSALGGVHTLNLSGCRNVSDVSALGGVHSLNLYNCQNVTDVSALGGVYALNLGRCFNITNIWES